MEQVKAFIPISAWALRIAILVLDYIIFFSALLTPDFKKINYLVAVGFTLFGILLFIGGFMKRGTLTIISSIFLIIGCGYEIVMHYGFGQGNFVAVFFVFGAISLFFFANGNKLK